MRHALPFVALVAATLFSFAGCSGDECEIDEDEDGYGVGCEADCDDTNPLHHSDCVSCSDPDLDGRGVACDLGPDCSPSNGLHWADCDACTDGDLDGRGVECDLGIDCDEDDPDQWSTCGACIDADGDGNYANCQAYVNRPGPDCDDSDGDNYLRCGYCLDNDGDGRFANCDRYTEHQGPDCNDADASNWTSCGTCRDADADTYATGCDSYTNGLKGPDCNDGAALHWADCGACQDPDLDGRGPGCDLGADCNTANRDQWSTCGSCADTDTDGRYAGCDAYFTNPGPDCNDNDPNAWSKCATCQDFDSDGRWFACDQFTLAKPGPDCNDTNRNVWASCGTCRDNDMDQYFIGCDAYSTISGPDCSDVDRHNWNSCATCADTDGDLRYAGCDGYSSTLLGPDCAPTSNLHWSDCSTCTTDTDLDGRGGPTCDLGTDCNEANPSHWNDCLTCTDVDGDGYGIGTCNVPGTDCADNDPTRSPAVADTTYNGVDENCDGFDGVLQFGDSFDSLSQWSLTSTDANIQSTYRVTGSFALNVGGGQLLSPTRDMSVCRAIAWRYQGKRGPLAPGSTDNVQLQYTVNGTTFTTVDTWTGNFSTDVAFALRQGFISAAVARVSTFRMRLLVTGTLFSDDFYIDDFAFGCASDVDNDSFADPVDCAVADADHWNDCGICPSNDTDFDDFGTGCNLGADCLEGNSAYNPRAADTRGDANDQNCDGVDGTLVSTSFSNTTSTAITDATADASGCGAPGAVASTIVVASPADLIADVDVSVNITHPNTGDLDVWIGYDDGVTPLCVQLSTDNGFGANYTSTVFSDQAATFITANSSPFTGTFRPEGSLALINASALPATYTLYVSDDTATSTGSLTSWGLTIRHY